MSRIIIVIQEKGGERKTFHAVHLTSYLQGLGHIFRPVDLDPTEGELLNFFPTPRGASASPELADIMSGASIFPQLLNRVLTGEHFIFDSGANTGRGWNHVLNVVMPEWPQRLKEKGITPTIIVPVGKTLKARNYFNAYKDLFPFATIVLSIIRDYTAEPIEIPEHPPELTIEIPPAPALLYSVSSRLGIPIDYLEKTPPTKLPNPHPARGMAARYLPLIHDQFDKIQHLLIP